MATTRHRSAGLYRWWKFTAGKHDQVQQELIARLERLEVGGRRVKQSAAGCLFFHLLWRDGADQEKKHGRA
jgi:hypothetical protein